MTTHYGQEKVPLGIEALRDCLVCKGRGGDCCEDEGATPTRRERCTSCRRVFIVQPWMTTAWGLLAQPGEFVCSTCRRMRSLAETLRASGDRYPVLRYDPCPRCAGETTLCGTCEGEGQVGVWSDPTWANRDETWDRIDEAMDRADFEAIQ